MRTLVKLFSSGLADAVPVVVRAVLAEGLRLKDSIHLCEVSNKECILLGGVSILTSVLSYLLAVSEMKCKFIQETIAKIRLHC